MSIYLKADCVFDFLISNKILKSTEWKNENKQTSYYNVSFECDTKMCKLCSFQITVKDGKHYVPKKSIELIALRDFSYNQIKPVFDKCI